MSIEATTETEVKRLFTSVRCKLLACQPLALAEHEIAQLLLKHGETAAVQVYVYNLSKPSYISYLTGGNE